MLEGKQRIIHSVFEWNKNQSAFTNIQLNTSLYQIFSWNILWLIYQFFSIKDLNKL